MEFAAQKHQVSKLLKSDIFMEQTIHIYVYIQYVYMYVYIYICVCVCVCIDHVLTKPHMEANLMIQSRDGANKESFISRGSSGSAFHHLSRLGVAFRHPWTMMENAHPLLTLQRFSSIFTYQLNIIEPDHV